MKYFYDTEFLEGTQKRRIGKYELPKMFDTKNTIDLISIGIVAEDNREYYAISKDFNLKEAWYRYDLKTEQVYGDMRNIFPNGITTKVYWIRENVLKPIWDGHVEEYNGRIVRLGLPIPLKSKEDFSFSSFKKMLTRNGKTNKKIAQEVENFCKSGVKYFDDKGVNERNNPEFYGYYSAYDHVALSWLFGKMIDLPKGFPMYSIDLKQELDNKYIHQENKYENLTRKQAWNQDVKQLEGYPKQTNEHNALADAKWNFELYKFLKSVK